MNKKIVILNGSPRPKGNTSALVEAFTKGAEEAGHVVTTFMLDSMNIKGCKGCFGGGKNPDSPCVQKDDMDKIYPFFKDADIVVAATPLYYWNFSGQLRIAFDRLFALAESSSNYKNPGKGSILMVAAGGDEFDEVVYYYERLAKHLGWNDLGKVLAGGVNEVGEIHGQAILEEARQLGLSLR